MKTLILALATAIVGASVGLAQQVSFDRLSPDRFDVAPPSQRVSGALGSMTIEQTSCRTWPMAEVRRRIVDVAVQEWGFFGFTVVDQTRVETSEPGAPRTRRRRRGISPTESARVAGSIAGYWTVTPEGGWIIDAQNGAWNGSRGVGARWRYPWSAAYVSWVMCEGGLGDATQFRRAVAHHTYIDQAIRARDDDGPQAFAAYDIGETTIAPGDLLCSARRPSYRSIADRRRQMGAGARTHCDIVVQVDASGDRILAIGGNVRGSVSLKLLPVVRESEGNVRAIGGTRQMFAHLKLRAESIEPDALNHSPTMQALGCAEGFRTPAALITADLLPTGANATEC